ncbi:MAG: SWIM zinc finger family protein, partial [Candidatus Thiodiazotropha sp.]
VNTIWGQCQGSGANPYYTMADVVDHGYKCTCPSRKFPCKHVLALMWQFADAPAGFVSEDPPEWVNDWLGRRRKNTGSESTEPPKDNASKKNIHAVEEAPEKALTPEELAKREAVKARRAAQNRAATDASISSGMEELQQWLADQLQTGIATFIKEINQRCRQIAARMVDAKAVNLASRLDEFPAKILACPLPQQPQWVLKEMGQLVLLAEAWLTDKDDADVRRAIVSTESREQVLSHDDALRRQGLWQTLGEKLFTRRDGLISHATWLVKTDEAEPCFALLQDYYPVGAGRREAGFNVGRQIEGELVYYPSRFPLRAVTGEYRLHDAVELNGPGQQGLAPHLSHLHHLTRLPWAEVTPCQLGQGRILRDAQQGYWWQNGEDKQQWPLTNQQLNPLLLGTDLHSGFVLWDGEQAELFSVYARRWGRLTC